MTKEEFLNLPEDDPRVKDWAQKRLLALMSKDLSLMNEFQLEMHFMNRDFFLDLAL